MLGTYSYHEILRKTVVGFGTLFNNIEIRRTSGGRTEVMKVPLAYGPQQKFLARLDQVGDLTSKDATQITLPRMSFEISGFTYDSSRKVAPTQAIRVAGSTRGSVKKVFMPVPYNIGFDLSIITKNQDDGLQILEQILPYFQPQINITINLVSAIGEKRDVPVILNSISYSDDYEGNYENRRAIIYTLSFVAKSYLFGPVQDSGTGTKLITAVNTDMYDKVDTVTAPRKVRYQVTPESLIDRDGVVITQLVNEIDENDVTFDVVDASQISAYDEIQIDNEVMHIKKKSGNTITVDRGYYTSTPVSHSAAGNIKKLDSADHALVESDDDFGFGELYSEFTDMKKYDPSTGNDVDI